MKNLRKNSRSTRKIRPLNINLDFCPASAGSVLIACGNTMVICAASVSDDVPNHAQYRSQGWVTAEYTMLPYSTDPRTKREILRKDGRSVEIQRLIGRSLRSALDLSKIQGFSITVDCDVLQADGGTRSASITGGFLALKHAVRKMKEKYDIPDEPIQRNIAAVSVGIVDGQPMLDLDYKEDSRAEVDLNVVMDDHGNIIEIQGTGEGRPFSQRELDEMLTLAREGISEIMSLMQEYYS